MRSNKVIRYTYRQVISITPRPIYSACPLISRISTLSKQTNRHLQSTQKKPNPLSFSNFQGGYLPSLTISMATEAENPSTAAPTTTVEDNPSKTLDTAAPASTKPDQVEDSSNTASSAVDSATEGPKQDADDSKSAAPATDTEKKIRRAERFGITVQLSEQEKRNSRAERNMFLAFEDVFLGKGLSLAFFWELNWWFREVVLRWCASGLICYSVHNSKWIIEANKTRFGTKSTSQQSESDSVKKSEELKRKARAERFGIPVPPTATDEEAKKKARLERFASSPKIDALEEDKRKARALRFSQSSSGSLSMNGNGDLEPMHVLLIAAVQRLIMKCISKIDIFDIDLSILKGFRISDILSGILRSVNTSKVLVIFFGLMMNCSASPRPSSDVVSDMPDARNDIQTETGCLVCEIIAGAPMELV
ncbi:unnamed protein product [Dovyalis caffra]|uniref:THO1-MOS11 C-terminal domain-containing protein n=1 Tax=Dovyalis caffra TaxID=77055 RepID=A0AAV1S273_9ROSI|nr:unnamed protein product [Dovyalis caffra]